MEKNPDPSQVVQDLEKAIASLETQRATLGDSAVDSAIQSLREKLAQLAASERPQQQRKMATILFMDIAGHTKMTRHLDPEDNMALIDSALVRLTEPVLQHGGHIARYQGDGFKAVFGLPTARENDPEHAVWAGLDIQAAVKEIAAEFEAQHGLVGFQVRVGIDTGLVVSGGTTEGEDTIKGTPVVMAARLESAAPPGGILISHDTYRHMRGLFVVQEREPLLAKGFEKPVRVYQVLQAKPRPFYMAKREFEGFETRTIGREAELLILQNAFQDVVESNEARLVTVVGDAGVGKSRLLYEFENWVDLLPENILFYKGRGTPESQLHPTSLWHDVFSYRFSIQDTDDADQVLRKFQNGVGEGYDLDKALIFGQLVGFDFSNEFAVRSVLNDPQFDLFAFAYLLDYFRQISSTSPVLLLVEDLHWVDNRSMDMLDRFLYALTGSRLLVVCLARPSLFERRPDWGSGQFFSSRLDLKPLSTRQSRLLVDEVLQQIDLIPNELRQLVVHETEGNPLYIEELVKMLLDKEVIRRGEDVGDRWSVYLDRLQEFKVPNTLSGLLQARVDGLPADEKDVLRRASVVGRQFWDAAIDYIALQEKNRESAPTVSQVWPNLKTRELIFHREISLFRGTEEYIFKHSLLRDAVYESVLKRLRRLYHQRTAEWLILTSGARADEFSAMIADHWALAEERTQEAVWQGRAGIQAARQHAYNDALVRLNRALDLTPEEDKEARYGLLIIFEGIYEVQGQRSQQVSTLEKLITLSEELNQPAKLLAVALRLANYYNLVNNYPLAIRFARKATEYALELHDQVGQAEANLEWGSALLAQSEFVKARAQLELALKLSQTKETESIRLQSFLKICSVARSQGDFTSEQEYQTQALQHARQLEDKRWEGKVLSRMASVKWRDGDRVDAKAVFQSALDIFKEIGARVEEAQTLGILGYLADELGESPGLYDFFDQEIKIYRESGNLPGECWAYFHLGEHFRYKFEGRDEEAKNYFERARQLAQKIGLRLVEGNVERELGLIARLNYDFPGAIRHFGKSLNIFRQLGDRFNEGWALNVLQWSLIPIGKYEDARYYVDEAIQLAREVGNFEIEVYALGNFGNILARQGEISDAVEQIEKSLRITRDLKFGSTECDVLCRLGSVYLDWQKYDEVIPVFKELVELSLQFDRKGYIAEGEAGLAFAYDPLGEHTKAKEWLDRALAHLEENGLGFMEEPIKFYLNCLHVLRASGDGRYGSLLDQAYAELQRQASFMDEKQRKIFLENIPENRKLLSLWKDYSIDVN